MCVPQQAQPFSEEDAYVYVMTTETCVQDGGRCPADLLQPCLEHLPAPPEPLHAQPATVGEAVSACLHARMRLLRKLISHAPDSAEVRLRSHAWVFAGYGVSACTCSSRSPAARSAQQRWGCACMLGFWLGVACARACSACVLNVHPLAFSELRLRVSLWMFQQAVQAHALTLQACQPHA